MALAQVMYMALVFESFYAATSCVRESLFVNAALICCMMYVVDGPATEPEARGLSTGLSTEYCVLGAEKRAQTACQCAHVRNFVWSKRIYICSG